MGSWRFNRAPLFAVCLIAAGGFIFSASASINVAQHHNHGTRDGLYIDPAFTYSAVSNLTRDLHFNGTISGNVYAQPLYIEGGPGGRAMIIAVTESNNVYALDAASGTVIWQDHVGSPVPLSSLPCGDINPLGITGTPVVDLPSRTLFLDAMTTPNGGTTKRHQIYALNVDTGTTNSGWPVVADTAVKWGTTNFTSVTQNERGALAVLNGSVYVPYGGHFGDCGTYYGWIVGVQMTNPTNVLAWATGANGGAMWAVGGVSNDGTNLFTATGNTFGANVWSGGEAIIRFQPGPIFTGLTNDYWAPTNWMQLDNGDVDLGGSGALLVDAPDASPSQLAVALGKDGFAYLLNRTNLGGVSVPFAKAHLSPSQIRQAAATYRTALGTYVVFSSDAGQQLISFRVTPTSPPGISGVWTNLQNGRGSPFVTSTDGTNNVVAWGIGSEGDQKLHGFKGDTGAVVFNGGGANELMSGTRRFNTAIAARGRIYVANDNKVYAFTVPVPPIILTNVSVSPGGMFQFTFTNTPGLSFTVYSTTNLALSITNWMRLGAATEDLPGQFQFTDISAPDQQRFYRVSSP